MPKSLIIFWRFFWERRISLLLTLAGIFLYVWLISAFKPVFFKNIRTWKRLIGVYPKEIFGFFGGPDINIFTVEGFLNMEFFSPWWIFIIGGYALSVGSAIIGRKIDKKTIELLLAQPLPRFLLLLSRFGAALLALLILASFTNLFLYGFSLYYDFTIKIKVLIYLAVVGFLFVAVLASLTLFLSLFFRERGRSISLAVAMLLVSYLLDSVGKIYDKVEWVRPFTLFFYYRAYQALRGDLTFHALALGGVFLLFTLLTFAIFTHQDITA